MAKRHGLYREAAKGPTFVNFGVWAVLAAVRVRAPRCVYYEMHFRHSMERLLHALDNFQLAFADVGRSIASFGGKRWLATKRAEPDAGVAADAALTYLNMSIDDIARTVPFVFSAKPMNPPKSFNELMKRLKKDPALYPTLRPLFLQLAERESWWSIGFERRIGMRQQVIHVPTSIQFQGTVDKKGRTRPVAYLWGPDVPTTIRDFETELRTMLHGWCEWLDRLEALLKPHLGDVPRAAWEPDCPRFHVPVGLTDKWRRIPSRDFLYLPVCEGSAAIGGRIRFTMSKPVTT